MTCAGCPAYPRGASLPGVVTQQRVPRCSPASTDPAVSYARWRAVCVLHRVLTAVVAVRVEVTIRSHDQLCCESRLLSANHAGQSEARSLRCAFVVTPPCLRCGACNCVPVSLQLHKRARVWPSARRYRGDISPLSIARSESQYRPAYRIFRPTFPGQTLLAGASTYSEAQARRVEHPPGGAREATAGKSA